MKLKLIFPLILLLVSCAALAMESEDASGEPAQPSPAASLSEASQAAEYGLALHYDDEASKLFQSFVFEEHGCLDQLVRPKDLLDAAFLTNYGPFFQAAIERVLNNNSVELQQIILKFIVPEKRAQESARALRLAYALINSNDPSFVTMRKNMHRYHDLRAKAFSNPDFRETLQRTGDVRLPVRVEDLDQYIINTNPAPAPVDSQTQLNNPDPNNVDPNIQRDVVPPLRTTWLSPQWYRRLVYAGIALGATGLVWGIYTLCKKDTKPTPKKKVRFTC